MREDGNCKMKIGNSKFKIFNPQFPMGSSPLPPNPYPLTPVFPCACLLDSVKDTPLFTSWLMLFVGGLFFLGAAVALFLAWKRGYLDFKAIEEVKYKVLENGER